MDDFFFLQKIEGVQNLNCENPDDILAETIIVVSD